jgi:hypothetical protein
MSKGRMSEPAGGGALVGQRSETGARFAVQYA